MTALTRTRAEIAAAWESFLVEGRLPDKLKPEIRRSWQRVRAAGHVDPRLPRCPSAVAPDDALARAEADERARIAARVVAQFGKRLDPGGHVVAFFGADGVMLAVGGNDRTRRRLEDVNFAPGSCWSESAAGTNGPGTALVEARPVEVFSAEHFVEAWQHWTCSSVPVRFCGRVIGAVDITTPWTASEPSLLLTAEALAQAIESRLEAEASDSRSAVLWQVAQEALRARDDFLAAASHELKTPLTPLRIKLQSAQRLLARVGKHLDAAQLEQVLGGAELHIGRLVTVIDGLLDTARVARDPLRPAIETFDLVARVRAVLERRQRDLERQCCAVALVAAREVVGRWDPTLLEQALDHVLVNAMKYAPGPIELHVEADHARVRVSIRDEGPGIAPEDQERIFEPYERAVSCQNIAGFGLGLHVVRQILSAHRGTVRVESTPGEGSTFVLELPLVREADAAAAPPVA